MSGDHLPQWLDRYGTNYHQWRTLERDGKETYYRPLGMVETAFDIDGTHFEGRADINALFTVETKGTLTREHLLLCWTNLRLHHTLLFAKAASGIDLRSGQEKSGASRLFVVDKPSSVEQVLREAQNTMHFLDDHYGHVDTSDFYRHSQNTARVVDSCNALAKLFVLPTETLPGGISRIRFLLIAAHQISEGLTMYSWMSHFLSLLNTKEPELSTSLPQLLKSESFQKRLPLPQEDHYPPIRGTRARQRWFWTLTLILRHIRKPLPPAFPNPLRRLTPRPHAIPMSPTYDKILNYTRTPPLNSFACQSILSPSTTARLHRLCREAGVSIGSGCFALCGMVMMELEEARHPHIPAASRKPFIGSFPLNPRQFFNHHAAPDSLMLAFSDGLVLPFLSRDLDAEGRFRLLARSAHRQLRIYQKRLRKEDEARLGARSPGRVIATNYIAAVERAEAKLPPQLRTGVNPQGAYPANVNFSGATCGVSSVGRTDAMLKQGTYSLDGKEAVEKGFVADFRSLDMGVRVRDDEFLIGIGGSAKHVFVNVSYDANAIDEVRVEEWRRRMEGILEGGETARL